MPSRAVLPSEKVLVDRLTRCIGIWETNRHGDIPLPRESELDTVADVHASMATIEQATMPYAIEALAKLPNLWSVARPPLTGEELKAARSCVAAVKSLLLSVDAEMKKGVRIEAFLASHRSAIAETFLADDDVRRMYDAALLRNQLVELHDQIEKKKTTLEKAVRSIKSEDALGLGAGSLKSYIRTPQKWGENRAGWQRKAVGKMPAALGERIESAATSDHGTALAVPVIQGRVREYVRVHPTAGIEDVIVNVAQENNPEEANYGRNVLKTYERLYPRDRKVSSSGSRPRGIASRALLVHPEKSDLAIGRAAMMRAHSGVPEEDVAGGAIREPSGKDWVKRFPDSKSIDELAPEFRDGCRRFIDAIKAGGVNVRISSTLRPDERAYLMHFCWRIHRRTINPQNVDPHPNVPIEWVHRDRTGAVDLVASRRAASQMVAAYGIVFAPARHSLHTAGKAIDMGLAWKNSATVVDANGKSQPVTAPPRNGFNLVLRRVGLSYGVRKHPTDPPHWSTTGR